MAKDKIRCTVCGAKNDLVDMCRICGTLLPGYDERRREGTGGAAFNETVESERGVWREYTAGRMDTAARSRRPASLPSAPPGKWHLDPGETSWIDEVMASGPDPEPDQPEAHTPRPDASHPDGSHDEADDDETPRRGLLRRLRH